MIFGDAHKIISFLNYHGNVFNEYADPQITQITRID